MYRRGRTGNHNSAHSQGLKRCKDFVLGMSGFLNAQAIKQAVGSAAAANSDEALLLAFAAIGKVRKD